jgi:cobalt-zinc-cadmium efflux system outer membrane protein
MIFSHKNTRKVPWLALGTLSLMLSGCGFQTYQPKPLDPSQRMQEYRSHNPDGSDFRSFAESQGYPTDSWPIAHWGLRELTLSALFFHPELDVARAQLQASQAREITAGQRQDPSISASRGRSEDEDNPWIYSLGLDIPLQTANKRELSLEHARSLSEAARIEIGQTAWQVRSRLLASWIDYNTALLQAAALQQEADARKAIADMLQKRLEAGVASSTELGVVRLQLQQTQQLLAAQAGRIPALKAALAANAGLSSETLERLQLATTSIDDLLQTEHENPIASHGGETLQDAALLNRLDIRAALARYEAAERKLRLEIASQYPDITLSPSRIYEEGFHIWQLGIGSLLPLLNKNSGLIKEARALREVEAAQFEALQAKVIGDLEQAKARYHGALDTLQLARRQHTSRQQQMRRIQRQFNNGYADRLELTRAKLENVQSLQNLIDAEYAAQQAAAALEDTLQQPLEFIGSLPDNMEHIGPSIHRETHSQEPQS